MLAAEAQLRAGKDKFLVLSLLKVTNDNADEATEAHRGMIRKAKREKGHKDIDVGERRCLSR